MLLKGLRSGGALKLKGGVPTQTRRRVLLRNMSIGTLASAPRCCLTGREHKPKWGELPRSLGLSWEAWHSHGSIYPGVLWKLWAKLVRLWEGWRLKWGQHLEVFPSSPKYPSKQIRVSHINIIQIINKEKLSFPFSGVKDWRSPTLGQCSRKSAGDPGQVGTCLWPP